VVAGQQVTARQIVMTLHAPEIDQALGGARDRALLQRSVSPAGLRTRGTCRAW
jgi:hypothetical protein